MSNKTELDLILKGRLPGYERRVGQERMASAVATALETGTNLIVEAGTGTGKSLAYLLPLAASVLEREGRAIVSTYTKALQRQLFEKDLPFVRDNIHPDLKFALSFGSENYICLRRLAKARKFGLFVEDGDEITALLKWASSTETGLRSEINPPPGLWLKVCRDADLCRGHGCADHHRCLYQKARAIERESHIIVANHHLFFAHVASGFRVLPKADVAVFDEAHELEDVAADYLGVEVSNYSFRHLFDSVLGPGGKGLLTTLPWLSQNDLTRINSVLNNARAASDAFFAEAARRLDSQKRRIRQAGLVEDTISSHLARLAVELEAIQSASGDDEERKEAGALKARCVLMSESVSAILGHGLEGHVYWGEVSRQRTRLVATPLDVAGIMRKTVFSVLDSSVLTSATLTTNGSFDFIKERLGLEDWEELAIGSPFDFERQALIYIPHDMPEPSTSGYEESLIARVEDILGIMGGRTLVLFTSRSMLDRAVMDVDGNGVRVLRQGDADSYTLINEFRSDPRSAVFGTYTFWQGVDVPGEALECVVVTKLPFAVPDEPVVEARCEALKRSGRDPFSHYQVPNAAIMLKQGFGRLVRTSSDRGVVAILDSRIIRKKYGAWFIKSLPGCKITSSLDDVKGFFDKFD